ncbi:hypothetical protein [Halalkalicoccus jeotgali]|uniref:Uncharacterized protein n=1 Tax=Halalkalicoccus jeotgali (strain DSM 18796 / CECT 7217 / JCM 14584 / KCTC 4019 / B3) TaxID=795797 RepID=D8JAH8_HALJB|nr:hypothetical protein [Halalkalicoccus jeotgali]ADJ14700.1 hypothetical protein HacjB3_06545 [Halalkalicoccus jeotgali B3]ELY39598.1 hypothetical protein C497_04942 [Halalkalicoccus jeotgali B3]
MSANDRTFDDAITEAKAILEGHDEAEYEALSPSAKANYQEALEFLLRLEDSIEDDTADRGDSAGSATGGRSPKEAETADDPEFEIDTDLESTMGDDGDRVGPFGDDGDRVGPFGGDDVVVYDPKDDDGWLSMRYDATIPIENMR